MYWQDRWVIKDSIEYEIKYAGRYGARGEKRGQKKKASPEAIKKQNQRIRETKMRRTIKANFDEGDFWITLKYKKGDRKPVKEVKKDIRRFLDTMRRRYKAHECEFKFVYRLEIGSQGGIHIHMILPRIRGEDTEMIIQKAWSQGRVNYQNLDNGEYKELAAYIVKQPDEEVCKQLSFFDAEERKEFVKYSSSRNLIRPEPERKVYKQRTVRKMIDNGIKPTKGYYVVKDSVVIGMNKYTGMSFIHYTERKIESG